MAKVIWGVPGGGETQEVAGDDRVARAASCRWLLQTQTLVLPGNGMVQSKGAAVQTNSLMGLETSTQLPVITLIKKSEQQVPAAGRQHKHLLLSSLFCAPELVLSLPLQIITK